jgi:transcriptional regulator with GAF, ATPase, and Fis domain
MDDDDGEDFDELSTRRELMRLAQLVRDMQEREPADMGAAFDSLTESAAKFVPGAQYAGITITHGHNRIETLAGTGRYPSVLDQIQHRHREGPCVSAAWEQHTISLNDIAADGRWPHYRREALEQTPIRSVLSVQLFTTRQMSAALNFYAEQDHAFDEDSLQVGLAFAAHMALVWSTFHREEQFRSALESRDVIGQAKGILMERFDLDSVEAFDLMRGLSQRSNIPVAEIARRLVRAEHPPHRPPQP